MAENILKRVTTTTTTEYLQPTDEVDLDEELEDEEVEDADDSDDEERPVRSRKRQ